LLDGAAEASARALGDPIVDEVLGGVDGRQA
jgi:hypothetical protein